MPTIKPQFVICRFVYHELFAADRTLTALPGFEGDQPDLVDAILEEGAKLFEHRFSR